MAATDFFTVEIWTARGLVTYYVLLVMRLKTRCVHIAGHSRSMSCIIMLKEIIRVWITGCLNHLTQAAQPMRRFIVVIGLAVCSTTTIVKQLEHGFSVYCTIRAMGVLDLTVSPGAKPGRQQAARRVKTREGFHPPSTLHQHANQFRVGERAARPSEPAKPNTTRPPVKSRSTSKDSGNMVSTSIVSNAPAANACA